MTRLRALCGTAALMTALAGGLAAQEQPGAAGTNPSNLDLQELIAKAKAASGGSGPGDPKKYRDFAEVTKDAQKSDGLLSLYRKDDRLYAEIKPMQFNQSLLVPITIARGVASAGQPQNFEDEWVIYFKRAGDRVQLVRKNIHYKAPLGTPIEKAVQQNYTDSILMALPIVSINPMTQGVLIDLNDIFFTDFAQLGLGMLDRSRTNWHKVKAFPNNVELEVEATFSAGGRGGFSMFGGADDGIADARGITIVIHYSLNKLPDPGYAPRRADDRVGHFLNAVKDFGSTDPDGNFVRMINRWRLDKADSRAKLSPPKRQIVWWLEDNIPHEYRPAVMEGILEWNKAFEKIGIRDAMAVRWQNERDDFDPEDINYCTFRWITTANTFAMSALKSNPLTGEMIDGDVIFDASWINAWKNDYAVLTGIPTPNGQGGPSLGEPIAIGEVISPIMASKYGYGTPSVRPTGRAGAIQPGMAPGLFPADVNPIHWALQSRNRRPLGASSLCQYSMHYQMDFAALALAVAADPAPKGDSDKDKEKPVEAKLPEELVNQAIKEVVMHEVGHSLGLRHNFKSSTMLKNEQLHDPAITRVKGITGSVMDYAPINIAPKGVKQGDFFSTTLGPYDYWAIEYAYKPVMGDEANELKKIASRAPEPDLVYATDEDVMLNDDPLNNRYDLGADPMAFAKERMTLARELLKDLDAKVLRDGESYSKARRAFSVLFDQWGDAAFLIAQHIGGQSVSRDHKGDKGARDPVVAIAGDKQREALNLLVEQILSDKSFSFSPALLRKMGHERWSHWGTFPDTPGLSLYDRILGIQRIALELSLGEATLARLQEQELRSDAGSNPLSMAEVFRALTDGIWSELSDKEGKPSSTFNCSAIRRNLQREHIGTLAGLVLGPQGGNYLRSYSFVIFPGADVPADARSLARMHLKRIDDRIAKVLDAKDVKLDDTCRAHLEETRHRIAKVLDAHVTANEP